MPLPSLNVNEIVTLLKRTNIPTVLVEGIGDFNVLRLIEERATYSVREIDFIPCGGKQTLFNVYKRKNEFSSKKVAFLADRDMNLFKDKTKHLKEIVWTKGYSIENDIFAGSKFLLKLLKTKETLEFETTIREICRWFAFEVEKYLRDEEFNVQYSIYKICRGHPSKLCSKFLVEIGFRQPDGELLKDIIINFKFKLRGKQIFQVLERILNSKKRYSKFSKNNLIELALKLNQKNIYLNNLIEKISSVLD
jgi:hypothetical protein